jgi:hypothetical protein
MDGVGCNKGIPVPSFPFDISSHNYAIPVIPCIEVFPVPVGMADPVVGVDPEPVCYLPVQFGID